MILPATLGWREAGKAEHPYFTDWETEVQKGEVTCPRSHSKSGLLTPSLVHFPHRDRGQRPRETETRSRETCGQGTWRGKERKTESDREHDNYSPSNHQHKPHLLKVGSVVPVLQTRKLRLREVSSTIGRELDGGFARNRKQEKEGDREMETGIEDRYGLGSRGHSPSLPLLSSKSPYLGFQEPVEPPALPRASQAGLRDPVHCSPAASGRSQPL